jgi:hypothetical protein
MVMGSFRCGKKKLKLITQVGWQEQTLISPVRLGASFLYLKQNTIVFRPLMEYRVTPNLGLCVGAYTSVGRFKNTSVQRYLGSQHFLGSVLAINQYYKHWFTEFSYQQSLFSKEKVNFVDDNGEFLYFKKYYSQYLQLSVGYLF